jgi:hypothetical protein
MQTASWDALHRLLFICSNSSRSAVASYPLRAQASCLRDLAAVGSVWESVQPAIK